MTHILAICNQKGGVGKTQTTISLGAALAASGQRVWLIDLDPQGHLTEAVGLGDMYASDDPGLYDAVLNPSKFDITSLVQTPEAERFSIVPTTYKMSLADKALYMAHGREEKLHDLLVGVPAAVDWVLIDCPPELNNLTDNALYAARKAISRYQAICMADVLSWPLPVVYARLSQTEQRNGSAETHNAHGRRRSVSADAPARVP